MSAPRPSAWPVVLALLIALVLAALAFNIWQSKRDLAARLSLAENQLRLQEAELRATRNQLEAERILAAAQAKQWQAAEAELARLRAAPSSTAQPTTTRLTHADVQARYKRAQELAKAGQAEAALADFLWCYDEGMVRVSSFAGVRSSFLLGEIARLGQSYPPALAALRARRDELAKALAANPGEFGVIADYSSLNRALNENEKNVALFESMPAGDERRGYFGLEVYDAMAKARRYKEALEAHSYKNMVSLFDSLTEDRPLTGMSEERQKDIRERNRAGALKRAADNLEVLIGAGQIADAHEYVEKILGYDDKPSTQQMIREAAARAGRPDLFAP